MTGVGPLDEGGAVVVEISTGVVSGDAAVQEARTNPTNIAENQVRFIHQQTNVDEKWVTGRGLFVSYLTKSIVTG